MVSHRGTVSCFFEIKIQCLAPYISMAKIWTKDRRANWSYERKRKALEEGNICSDNGVNDATPQYVVPFPLTPVDALAGPGIQARRRFR